jgi:hypothetical protein
MFNFDLGGNSYDQPINMPSIKPLSKPGSNIQTPVIIPTKIPKGSDNNPFSEL